MMETFHPLMDPGGGSPDHMRPYLWQKKKKTLKKIPVSDDADRA